MLCRSLRSLCLLLLATSGLVLPAQSLPKVRIFATGGTIAGVATSRDLQYRYRSGATHIDKIIAEIPELQKVAQVDGIDIANVSSGAVNAEVLLKLAHAINDYLAQPDTAGAVVTHGTDTLEETAFFLNLAIHSEKPVVILGAMRPYTSISRDGPFNIYNGVRVAADPDARRMGAMIVMNEEIQAARDATKTNTERVSTFDTRELGPIGYADEDRIVFYRRPLYKRTFLSEFNVDNLTTLPRVDICYGYQEADSTCAVAMINAGARGIITDGGGGGREASKLAREKGVVIVAVDRKGSGRLMTEGPPTDRPAEPAPPRPAGAPAAAGEGEGPGRGVTGDNLNAQKARMLLRLALTRTSDPKEIQRIFEEY